MNIICFQPYTYDADGNEYEWHIALTTYVTIVLAKLTRISGVSIVI